MTTFTTLNIHVPRDTGAVTQTESTEAADAVEAEIKGDAREQTKGTYVVGIDAEGAEVTWFLHSDDQARRMARALRRAANQLIKAANG